MTTINVKGTTGIDHKFVANNGTYLHFYNKKGKVWLNKDIIDEEMFEKARTYSQQSN